MNFHASRTLAVTTLALCTAVLAKSTKKGELIINYEKPLPDAVLVTCAYCGDEVEPNMMLTDKNKEEIKVNTFVSNAYDKNKKCFLVNMQLVMMDKLLPKQTVFECVLKDTMSGKQLKKTIDYVPSSAAVVSDTVVRLTVFLAALASLYRNGT